MKNKRNKKGFTLAELLIVVAIIAVLVAIAIPIFTQQLEKSREASDVANVRSAYAEAVAGAVGGETADVGNVKVTGTAPALTYTVTTANAQSTGKFEKVDLSDVSWWTNASTFSVTKGSPFKVAVTLNDAGDPTVSVTQ